MPNYGWCFDCVPEENSLLLGFGELRLEIPSIDLVFDQPRALLGDAVHARFGDEFPIRFDFLDTMGGGNLSFQVHPLTEYIQQTLRHALHAGRELLHARCRRRTPASTWACGRAIDPAAMVRDLEAAQARRPAVSTPTPTPTAGRPRSTTIFSFPPARCIAPGRNAMVLEISATPYIFTFKLWDWGRLGLDGKPRPIHLEHGAGQHPVGPHHGLGDARTWSTASSRWQRATAGGKSGPACTSASSSRRGGTGSPRPFRTTRRAASTC